MQFWSEWELSGANKIWADCNWLNSSENMAKRSRNMVRIVGKSILSAQKNQFSSFTKHSINVITACLFTTKAQIPSALFIFFRLFSCVKGWKQWSWLWLKFEINLKFLPRAGKEKSIEKKVHLNAIGMLCMLYKISFRFFSPVLEQCYKQSI